MSILLITIGALGFLILTLITEKTREGKKRAVVKGASVMAGLLCITSGAYATTLQIFESIVIILIGLIAIIGNITYFLKKDKSKEGG